MSFFVCYARALSLSKNYIHSLCILFVSRRFLHLIISNGFLCFDEFCLNVRFWLVQFFCCLFFLMNKCHDLANLTSIHNKSFFSHVNSFKRTAQQNVFRFVYIFLEPMLVPVDRMYQNKLRRSCRFVTVHVHFIYIHYSYIYAYNSIEIRSFGRSFIRFNLIEMSLLFTCGMHLNTQRNVECTVCCNLHTRFIHILLIWTELFTLAGKYTYTALTKTKIDKR